jgi:glycosyltransferase involved in cell wall biosynthesis
MTSNEPSGEVAPTVSIGIFAWNEESALRSTLQSLLEQSLFAALHQLSGCCEIICVANGCTDRTAEVAAQVFAQLAAEHPHRAALRFRVANILERGKVNAWNQYVHQLSAPSASTLFMMDADILIHRKETLERMLSTLEHDTQAHVAVDVPRKHLTHKHRRSLFDRLSLSASETTLAADGQLCGQLYCIRAEVARRIYLPKDLSACEDGLIKTFVCTDFLAHAAWPKRIRVAPGAEHTFEAYTTPRSILKNQKRQIIGQTMLHVLVDVFLQSHPSVERDNLARFLEAKDACEPAWLKRLVAEHLKSGKRFWQLYPGLLSIRFRRLRHLSFARKISCLPATLLASGATLAASWMAYRCLKSGCTDYWPKAERTGLQASYNPGC